MSRKRNRRATRPQTKHTQVKKDETRTLDEKSLETAVESDTLNTNSDSSAEQDSELTLSDEATAFADTSTEVNATAEEKTEEAPSVAAGASDDLVEEVALEDIVEENNSEGDTTPSTTEDDEPTSVPDEIHSLNTDDDLAFLDDESLDDENDEENEDLDEDDDEAFMSSDRVIHTEDSLAIVQQMDHVVSWEIVNFYRDNGKVPNRFVMRNSPPIFKVSSSDGSAAEFLVTKDLAKTFEKIFGDVSKAYYGVDPTVKKKPFNQTTLKEKANNAIEWGKENPFKATLLAIVIIFIVISPLLYG